MQSSTQRITKLYLKYYPEYACKWHLEFESGRIINVFFTRRAAIRAARKMLKAHSRMGADGREEITL